MKLRRFTSAGVEMARQYLAAVKESNDVENVTLNGQPFTRAALISSPAYSDAIPALADIDLDETRTFDTTFAFCEYFDSLIHGHNPQAYRDDVGFWTWLVFVYFPQLVKVNVGKVCLGEQAKLIYTPNNYQRQYRHFLAGPYYLYFYYREVPNICRAVLTHKMYTLPDITEQITSRYDVVHNPAYLAVVNELYFDKEKGILRRGAGGKGPSAPRNLVRVIDQLAMTRDFFDVSDSACLLKLLPSYFSDSLGI